MRQITYNAVQHFMNGKSFKSSNTEIVVSPNVTTFKLFGNEIAYKYNDPEKTISITNCGYQTVTTKERLNAIPGVNIQQKNFVWYLNGQEWDGNLINI